MKFIHVTDTHLGRKDRNLEERRIDYYNSFKQVVDYAIENNIDFVLHTGDLFDKARPSVKTLIFAVKQLERLKEKNIPVFLVPGSHDVGVGETIISLFDELNLIKDLSDKRYFKEENGDIILDGELYKNVFICGVVGKRSHIEDIYRKLKPAEKGEYRIFALHHIVSDVIENFADIPTSLLPKNFDYYAGGHWHGFFEMKYNDGIIVYPGSTEYNDLKEIESGQERVFCVVNTKTNSVEKIKLKTRKHIVHKINCDGLDAREIASKCIDYLESKEIVKDAILIIKLEGVLSKGTKAEINRNKILEWANEKGFLTAIIYLSNLENPERPFVSSKKTPKEVEKEYLEMQKYSKSDIKLARGIIASLGNVSGKEKDVAVKETIKFVEGALIEDKKD